MQKIKYGDKKILVFLTFILLISSVLNAGTLYSMKFITDYAVLGDVNSILNISKILIAIIILELIINLFLSKLKSLYINKSMIKLKKEYTNKLFSLDILSISQKDNKQYLNQLSNDMDRYEEKFYMNLIKIIQITTKILVSIIILASVNVYLVIFAILLLIFFINISKKTSKPIEEKEQIKSHSLETYTNYIKESLDGFIEIKQNKLNLQRRNKFKYVINNVQNDNYEIDKKSSKIDALNNFIQFTILFSVIYLGLFIAKKNNLSLGNTLLVGSAFANSIWPMQEITPLISKMKGIGTILKSFDKTLQSQQSKENIKIDTINSINFDKVELNYGDTVILNNVNISINKGDKVLIIGESGSGKSTLLKSIRRQIPINSGNLEINNISIDNIYAYNYFTQISIVDQIGFIFNGTVLENITLYKKCNNNEIISLLKEVGLDLDLNTNLSNNGSNISGGQRARLLLARSLFNKSSLLICDEIFANLDKSIAQNIEKDILSLNITLINVSHIIFKDNIHLYNTILLVENGKVKKISFNDAIKRKN